MGSHETLFKFIRQCTNFVPQGTIRWHGESSTCLDARLAPTSASSERRKEGQLVCFIYINVLVTDISLTFSTMTGFAPPIALRVSRYRPVTGNSAMLKADGLQTTAKHKAPQVSNNRAPNDRVHCDVRHALLHQLIPLAHTSNRKM
jgi:hypothetical protein